MGLRLFGSVAIAGCIACSSGGGGGGGGIGGSGGVAPDASSNDAGADADVDADAAAPVLFQDTCTFNESLLLAPDRTLMELAFAHPFVRIVGGDTATCCFQGLSP